MNRIYRRIAALTLAILALGALSGCAGHAERYRQGLQWHLDTEAQKKSLNQQGFPQYGWY